MKRKYINNGGEHRVGKLIVAHGETFYSDDPDLLKKFPVKFALYNPEAAAAKEAEEVEEDKDKDTSGEGGEGNKGGEEDKDVTSDFPIAVENKLTVTKDKKGWWVFDGDKEPVNEKPLLKGKVEEYITELLA